MLKTPASLLQRLKRPDDQDAWQRFVKLYTPLIYDWARRAGLSEDEAADLAQDVFLLLIEKLPQFQYDPKRSFRGWLKTITLNKWREGIRRGRIKTLHASDDEFSDGGVADPVAVFEEAEYQQRLVRQAMGLIRTDFEPVTWNAWWEYVVIGRPATDVANQLGITANAVYLAKSRVLRRLRKELDGLLD